MSPIAASPTSLSLANAITSIATITTSDSIVPMAPSTSKPTLVGASSTEPPSSVHHLTRQAKIAIGVSIPLAAMAIAVAVFIFMARAQRKKKEAKAQGTSVDSQPYLQPKGELSAEERQKYELHAETTKWKADVERYELSGEGRMELSTTKYQRRTTCLLGQELRGGECAEELEHRIH